MTVEEVNRVKKAVIRRYPISAGLALKDVKITLTQNVRTASVNAEKDKDGILKVTEIKVNTDFFDRLSFSERVFVLAHEALHVALRHFSRGEKKPVKDAEKEYEEYCSHETDPNKRMIKQAEINEKYRNIWNIATDACINAFLRKDGFTFPENVIDPQTGKKMQFVDLKDGFTKSAEKIYDILVKQEQEKEQQQQKQPQQQTNNGSGTSGDSIADNSPLTNFDGDIDNYDGFDSHDEWNDSNNTKDSQQDSNNSNDSDDEIDDEEVLSNEINNRDNNKPNDKKGSFSSLRKSNGIGDFTPSKPIITWKNVLIGSVERVVEKYGYRRASRNYPNARIEERYEETGASVEVILDVSASISDDLLRGFLLQIYPLFQEVFGDDEIDFKVGCFANTFSGFQRISSKKEIQSFKPTFTGGTNFEVAATSFSKSVGQVTKIVFTDGMLGSPQTTRVPDIIWIVFGDHMNFTPLGGKIIRVSSQDVKDMIKSNFIEEDEIGQKRI